jgi:hypothetical protein
MDDGGVSGAGGCGAFSPVQKVDVKENDLH